MNTYGSTVRHWCAAVVISVLAGQAVAATAPNAPVPDPNFPVGANYEDSIPGKGVMIVRFSRNYGQPATIPLLALREPSSLDALDYLGFINGSGSLVFDEQDGAVYLYNRQAHAFEMKYHSKDEVPLEVIESLSNRKYVYTSKREALKTLPLEPTVQPVSVHNQEVDPNQPPYDVLKTQPDAQLLWSPFQSTTQPAVIGLPKMGQGGLYLGFNARGSWVASTTSGKVFWWNWPANTLTPAADSWWDVPLDLHNPSPTMLALIYYREHAYTAQNSSGYTADPNFPPSLAFSAAQRALPLQWTYTVPNQPPAVLFVIDTGFEVARYLGFDERGAWLWCARSGIVVWNFKTLTLTAIAKAPTDIPKDALARVHNADPILAAGSAFPAIRR